MSRIDNSFFIFARKRLMHTHRAAQCGFLRHSVAGDMTRSTA
jgi:hypothetical protein